MDKEVYRRIRSSYRRIRRYYRRNMCLFWKKIYDRGGREGGTEVRELDKGAMFPKHNIAGDTKTMRDRIITPIPLLSFAIAKKTTKP